MQTYSLEDIWEKEIYLLIPFYIFTHEANFPKYNEDENLLQELVNEFKEICIKMEELTQQGKMSELERRISIPHVSSGQSTKRWLRGMLMSVGVKSSH